MTEPNTTHGQKLTDDAGEFSVEEWANRMVIYAKGAEIRTVDQLLDAANIDTNTWEICGKPHLNKWSVGAKVKDADLEFDDGRMTGTMAEHGLVIAPMFQVKLTLVRKKPVEVFPTIQPVACPERFEEFEYSTCASSESHRPTRALIFADNQIGYERDIATGKLKPYHDRRCLDLAIQIAKAANVDEVIVAGDWLDLAEWSDKFVRSPSFFQTTQPSIEEAFFWLRLLRGRLGRHVRITVKLGNHEQRMRNMVARHLPFAYDLTPVAAGVEFEIPPALSLPSLLQLDKLAIRFDTSPSNEADWLNDVFGVLHGDIVKHVPGATARAYVEKYHRSVIFFHTHRAESVTIPVEFSKFRRLATAMNPGCMCHVDGRVPGNRRDNAWTNGFAVVDYDADDLVTMTHVPIVDGVAMYNGQMFVSMDESRIVDMLSKSFGRWQW